jgi:hypothetical protein
VTFANPITVASGNTGTATITDTANSTFSGAVTLNSHDLTLARAANNLILSGGITGHGNLALSTSGAGTLTLSTASVNNTGTITNSGAGAGAATISTSVGAERHQRDAKQHDLGADVERRAGDEWSGHHQDADQLERHGAADGFDDGDQRHGQPGTR